MKRDEIDALLVAGFFVGYAVMLALSRRVPRPSRPSIPLDRKRLTFWQGMRDALINEENMTSTDAKLALNAAYGKAAQHGD